MDQGRRDFVADLHPPAAGDTAPQQGGARRNRRERYILTRSAFGSYIGFSDASRRKALAGDLDLVGRAEHIRLALALARHIAQADRAAEVMAVIARGDRADDLAVAQRPPRCGTAAARDPSAGTAPAGGSSPASRFLSTASRPMKSPLPVFTAKPRPASSTWSSSVMSWPKWRNAFSMRQESSVCSPQSFSPNSAPASSIASNTCAAWSVET